MNELDFSGKTVLVIGGSSGIGNGIAQRFRRHGADVHVWGTRPAATDYADEEGSELEGLTYRQVDLYDLDNLEALDPGLDTLDVLVLSQGVIVPGGREFERENWDKVIDLNLNSVMACAVKFRPLLAADGGGSLIMISSIQGYVVNSDSPAYSASKAALISLVKSLGKAWGPEGIRVNGIGPGVVVTKLNREIVAKPHVRDKLLSITPARRFATADDMGGVALFLASPLASFVIGETLLVDGGMTITSGISGALGR